MLKLFRLKVVGSIALLLLMSAPAPVAYASNQCSVVVTPSTIASGSEGNLQFDLQNTGDAQWAWASVTRPSADFIVNGISQSGWTDATDETGTTLTGNSQDPGTTLSLQLAMQTSINPTSGSWTVLVSDSPDGSGAVACGGNTNVSISGHPSIDGANGVSNIQATIRSTSAVIAWNSDADTSTIVYFGTTNNYGSNTTYDSNLTSNHQVTLTGLNPATGYHFQVAGTGSDGSAYYSGDNTFITDSAPVPPPAALAPLPSPPAASQVPVVAPTPGDQTPPQINVSTSFVKPFTIAPVISGTASDNEAVAKVEYSTDDGSDWLPAEHLFGLGGRFVTFSFKPNLHEDGNYQILARAIDGNGNIGVSLRYTMVIDRMPPQMGPLVVASGPEVLKPDSQGMVSVAAGSDYQITISGVGGPISVKLEADLTGSKSVGAKVFTLSQSPDSGLWKGLLSFAAGGQYQLRVVSLDGAGNITDRQLMTVAVSPPGRVVQSVTKANLPGSRISLYVFEQSSKTWLLWDGSEYSQPNPQLTKANGSYSLMPPKGTYYMSVSAPHFQTYTSNIFSLDRPTSLAPVIPLTAASTIKIGSLVLDIPNFSWQSHPLLTAGNRTTSDLGKLVNKPLPDFTLPLTSGATQTAIGLEGKPSVISILTTWSPDSQEQISALAAAQGNHDVNILPVFSQEHPGLVSTYLRTSKSNLIAAIDQDGVLVPLLEVADLPENIFVDREGRIKKVMLGVLSKDEIFNQLGGL